ncbi:putative heme-thiolate peroxidase [Hericium alpestre]|uniref:Putative heme-thiolate peroxidase n=1 Tax=Hericium alpestre TaxID=135208 RepID=A0A4Y9ZU41_9AGAM|nr:putative heme-thiolate peroxidase [Hericium alpestre]
MEGYGLSAPLGYLLGYGAIVLMRKMPPFDLYDFAAHGGIEHNASLYHDDADGEKYAPVFANEKKLEDFLSKLPAKVRAEDIAAVRVAKEDAYETVPLDALHGEIARGEVSISLGVFTEKGEEVDGVPLERFREWLSKERFPEGWTPHHVHGLLETVMTARDIRLGMERIRKEKKEMKKVA